MRTALTAVWICLLGLLLAGCSDAPQIELKGQRYTVEVADEPRSWQIGLMFRDKMPLDHGMLFIFPDEEPRGFWMKNTRIPLDILYFDRDLRLVSVAHRAQPCKADPCPSYPSAKPARYVLELNAGQAEQLGVEPGDLLELKLKR